MAFDLPTLLGPVPVTRFLTEHWERAPLLVRAATAGGPDRFADVLTLADFDRVVAETGLRAPTFRVARDGQTVTRDTWAVPTLPWGPGQVRDFARPERMFDLLRDGWTVVLENADRTIGPLARVSAALRQALRAHCYVHVFCTPASTRAFAPHYDVQDAFVLQCGGAKSWRVYAPHVREPLRDEPCPAEGVTPGELLLDVRLEPGDLLFVPRGFVHSVAAVTDAPSLHATFGVVPTTWYDLVQAALAELRTGTGGPGDEALRLDPRVPAALDEGQEDWLDEQVEDTLLDLDVETLAAELGARRAGPATPALPLSAGLARPRGA